MKTITTGEHAQTSETTRAPAMARKTMLVLTAVLALGSTAQAGKFLTDEGTATGLGILTGAVIGATVGFITKSKTVTYTNVGAIVGGVSGNMIYHDMPSKTYRAAKGLINGPSEKSKRIAAERRLANEGK